MVVISGTLSCTAGPDSPFLPGERTRESVSPPLFHSPGRFLMEDRSLQCPRGRSGCVPSAQPIVSAGDRVYQGRSPLDPGAGALAAGSKPPGLWFILDPLPMGALPGFGSHAGKPHLYLRCCCFCGESEGRGKSCSLLLFF